MMNAYHIHTDDGDDGVVIANDIGEVYNFLSSNNEYSTDVQSVLFIGTVWNNYIKKSEDKKEEQSLSLNTSEFAFTCPNCGSNTFSAAKDIDSPRIVICRCGWLPGLNKCNWTGIYSEHVKEI